MKMNNVHEYVKTVLENMPPDWLHLTTHRLDIYNEKQAKTEFLERLEALYATGDATPGALSDLATAFDYIRLGHPLSCLLEWVIAKKTDTAPQNVISFASQRMAILAILRKNALDNKATRIVYADDLPAYLDSELLSSVYGYQFELTKVDDAREIPAFAGTNILVSPQEDVSAFNRSTAIDFFVNVHAHLGSVLLIHGEKNEAYLPAIQHVRRRETIAMTPADCHVALARMVGVATVAKILDDAAADRASVAASIKKITDTSVMPVVASSGLSVQYAIMMGLIHDARENYPGKAIKFIVPPNCYGGTNDQARRVAAVVDNVEIVDLPVDGGQDMVESIELVLTELAATDAVPYIIAEIPTNPRVEVPDLLALKESLSKVRKTRSGETATDPVFILDQTFCPNVNFLGEGAVLSTIRTISYASGSKFPSGGLVTAGYCVGNEGVASLLEKVAFHLELCDNGATEYQMATLAKQLPSMNERIHAAYLNTREFVNFIRKVLPAAKLNFVSEALAAEGFTPSVFSLDLPTEGDSEEEKEAYKRELNYRLINLMIQEIPDESKFCVSYGQLKGCYWTIPATSTQGTTREGDKDYIVRASLAPDVDVEQHKKVFVQFANSLA
ncbi:PLP-dependent aminotransferase family protein [Neolewinella antarctica]|uniref:Cystathionine beta-lyase/cystathionine gamma-synthase n=1 Tax=Neolewinella antarctica TaxID=442734 RepID=A0ABX0X7D1_9BACT|nr:cystathionine beta-synthase [Neolewinella antarctica]NJC24906.1 cystathionine beta-lyase/cystathionine gamma-synthase [Neolewinella antarctica]